MLDDSTQKESDYHSFIETYPAFFDTCPDTHIVISKLRLGGDFVTDFVSVRDGYSNGTIYTLTEIETPHCKLFDSKGNPTKRFTTALQQLRDWKRFIKSNRSKLLHLLPTVSVRAEVSDRFKFRLVIGRREERFDDQEKRKQIEEHEEVEIISFDRLTDIMQRRYFNHMAVLEREIDDLQANQLANPFYMAFKEMEWRSICDRRTFHVNSHLINAVLSTRRYNHSLDAFISEVGN